MAVSYHFSNRISKYWPVSCVQLIVTAHPCFARHLYPQIVFWLKQSGVANSECGLLYTSNYTNREIVVLHVYS